MVDFVNICGFTIDFCKLVWIYNKTLHHMQIHVLQCCKSISIYKIKFCESVGFTIDLQNPYCKSIGFTNYLKL